MAGFFVPIQNWYCMEKEQFKEMMKEYTLTSTEVVELLGVTRAALVGYKKRGTLVPLKGNLYWREDVLKRLQKRLQDD
jgi:predicted transcriptional regulator